VEDHVLRASGLDRQLRRNYIECLAQSGHDLVSFPVIIWWEVKNMPFVLSVVDIANILDDLEIDRSKECWNSKIRCLLE
jgi:hypothetical protein